MNPESRLADFRTGFAALIDEVGRVIVGQTESVEAILTCLLADGHVLIEGVPGLGKSQLAHTLSEVLDIGFSRVQFTPDLMPGDIIGTQILQEDAHGGRALRFRPGPIFTNLLLADEINRATPKTQSALLEAMQERTVSVGRTSHKLDDPFFVLATQNPIEMEGTYPLPEAQLDRFFMKLEMQYPSAEELREILNRTTGTETQEVKKVLDAESIIELRGTVRSVPIADDVLDVAIRATLLTHPQESDAPEAIKRFVSVGASPRGTQSMVLGAKVRALQNDRPYVSVEDLRAVALPTLRHRILLNFEGQAEGISTNKLITDILDRVT